MSYYDKLLKTAPGTSGPASGRVVSRRSAPSLEADLSSGLGAPSDEAQRPTKASGSTGITAEQAGLGLLVVLGIIAAVRK